MLNGETAAWPYLRLVTFGQLDVQSGGNKNSFKGFYNYALLGICPQIHSGRVLGGILRKGESRTVQNFNFHMDIFSIFR